MSDISLQKTGLEPKTLSKVIPINILKSNTDKDLRAGFEAIAKAFNIKTADFFVKLGDLMLSSSSFSASAFQERFFNLIKQYSQGVVYTPEGRPFSPEILNLKEEFTIKEVVHEGSKNGSKILPFDQNIKKKDIVILNSSPEISKNNLEIQSSSDQIKKRNIELITPDSGFLKVNSDIQLTSLDQKDFRKDISLNSPSLDPSKVDSNIQLTSADQKDIKSESIELNLDKIISDLVFLANRTGTAGRIDVFLYNLIPYVAFGAFSQVASQIGTAISTLSGSPNFANPTGTKFTAADLASSAAGLILGQNKAFGLFETNPLANPMSYFTISELAYLAAANFYSLHFKRGISIKDLTTAPSFEFYPSVILAKPEFDNALTKILSESLSFNLYNYLSKNNWIWTDRTGVTNRTTLEDLIKETKTNRGLFSVGCVYIWPVDNSVGNPTIIPFEFNPIIAEEGVSARYQSMQILSRIGELQSFVGTSSLAVSLNVSYLALGETENETWNELEHLKYFNLSQLQKLELGYRSLVLPFFTSDKPTEQISQGYKYVRPPLVKIIMGDYREVENEGNSPYSNLLLYPQAVIGNKFNNIGDQKFRRFRTFICTSVRINKSFDDYNLYIKDGYIKDTMGFGVELNLIEISPSYAQSLPSFGDFYNAANLLAPVV